MTSHRSSHWPALSPKACRTLLLLCTLALASCSSSPPEPEKGSASRKSLMGRSLYSQLEWAIQDYEAGHYKEGLNRFEKLKAQGPAVPDFDLIPFYMGMSHYHLGELPRAAEELEAFLRSSPRRVETQDARISLLLAFERLAQWPKALGLAVETDRLSLFQYNRAVLKLVWARALAEQGELKGARKVLKDAEQYLDNSSETPFKIFSDPNQDLWGRYYFTSALIQEKEVRLILPRELGGTSKKRPRLLYDPWLEAVIDGLRRTLNEADRELFSRESPWSPLAGQLFLDAVEELGQRLNGYLTREKDSLDRRHALEKNAREQLYRLMSTLDDIQKKLKKQNIESAPLVSLRKRLDLLLMQISHPS